MAKDTSQAIFNGAQLEIAHSGDWQVVLPNEWNVLGPFPIHAREQHFLSPSFPLDLSVPLDFNLRWPSSYSDGGSVGWTTAYSKDDGTLEDLQRWQSLRATEGWAAVQHHSVLHTTFTVYPPSTHTDFTPEIPQLLVDLLQGSFFTILPSEDNRRPGEPVMPEWYAGNVYAMGRATPQAISLPSPPSRMSPTTYDLFVSGDYEIRLFGDPRHDASEIPKLSITLSISLELPVNRVVLQTSHDVSCDFVDGWAFGDALGVGIRNVAGWWTVKGVVGSDGISPSVQLSFIRETRIAPTQTRIIPIRITQNAPFHGTELQFEIQLVSDSESSLVTIPVSIHVVHHSQWSPSSSPAAGIKASYFFSSSMPTAFLVTPPEELADGPRPPILALHGAGVDIFADDFWIRALPRQKRSWVIVPTGRTAWVWAHIKITIPVSSHLMQSLLPQGLDWHGPSAQDAWGTVDALRSILNSQNQWRGWTLEQHTRVLVVGHSNGGQGAWYLASRWPDRVVGAMPAAGYIKSQAYVPLTQSRSAHFIDPALRAILETSLTPDDNDLFLANLADTPILAIHGGDDDNVPVWHTREAVSVLKTLNPQANVTFVYREDPGELHWYPSVFKNEQVESFMNSVLEQHVRHMNQPPARSAFTLKSQSPVRAAHYMAGRYIACILPADRLGRLTVEEKDGMVVTRTSNVRIFSINLPAISQLGEAPILTIDGDFVRFTDGVQDHDKILFFARAESGSWQFLPENATIRTQPSGRMANILTAAPLTFVIPNKAPSRALSAALRLAHNLDVYHKLDAEIIDDAEAMLRLDSGSLGPGNIVVLALGPQREFFKSILAQSKTAFALHGTSLQLRGRTLDQPSSATLFLHPHPFVPSALMLFMYASDDSGFEKAVRLFPIRTGVTVPDWIYVGGRADTVGAGGVEGAGLWGNAWSWDDAMSVI
ncbi:hypothetical protein A0H81_04588 [Grifola frondosa]|uniref:Peptidase S9 prolyl oligopeptidase catalytic domain-containing protein n=1 Tax=Grifola frondosa TaxID=5627 RepID=A0A1C7MG01_GRIFR|nr:hypothetical protein A0H81_04588 [Grifola frondosa]